MCSLFISFKSQTPWNTILSCLAHCSHHHLRISHQSSIINIFWLCKSRYIYRQNMDCSWESTWYLFRYLGDTFIDASIQWGLSLCVFISGALPQTFHIEPVTVENACHELRITRAVLQHINLSFNKSVIIEMCLYINSFINSICVPS